VALDKTIGGCPIRALDNNWNMEGYKVLCWLRRSAPSPPPSLMPSFNPKPFPPPALSDVPVEYIIDQLHGLANQFWDKPETADCTISASQ